MNPRSYYEGKRVLVTGSTGFVGTHLVHYLVGLGAIVRGTIHLNPVQRPEPKVEYFKCDLTRLDDCLKATKDIHYVFMAAANSSGAEVIEKTPIVHLTPNVMMNTNMLAASHENDVSKYCFISSNTVYPPTNFAVKESDTNYQFFDKYFIVGWMKLFSEIMCQMYAEKIKNPMQAVVVRPGNLYGPYDKYTWKESKVIAALIRRSVEKHDPFTVWGNGSDVKDFLYVEDFVQGLLISFIKIEGFAPLNIASGQPVTISEILEIILNAADYSKAPVQFDLSKPMMIPKRLIDTSFMFQLTGWVPPTTLKEGIQKTIDWYRTFYASYSPEETIK